jgi:stage V sporulation protein R
MSHEFLTHLERVHESDERELDVALEQIWDIAAEHHLDPFPTIFEIAPAEIVYQVGSYGVPGHYSHWTHGRDYQHQKNEYDYGVSRIYELVINSNPSVAYLLENNSPLANKLIMAHVFGHTDFFKNNVTFRNTRRDMPEAFAKSAERIEQYESRVGTLEVERFLDAVKSLANHVDPYVIDRPDRDVELAEWQQKAEREAAPAPRSLGEFDDLFETRHVSTERHLGKRALMMMPPEPDADLLGFIRNHAPYLDDWQRDIVDIARSESLYFYPQRRTKIMNEGWAAYWHKRIMREMGERDLISPDDTEEWAKLHAGIVAPNPRQLNPYYLGMKMYEYIEDYYNGTLDPDESAYLEHEGVPTYPRYDGPLADSPAMPHLRDAMMFNDDQSFIRNYFNKIVSDRMELFVYEEHRKTPLDPPEKIVVEGGWSKIRDMLVQQLDNAGIPQLVVSDGDYAKAGELYITHKFDGRSIDPEYVHKTLPYLYQLWQRPVHLETVEAKSGKKLVYRFDGDDVSAEKEQES